MARYISESVSRAVDSSTTRLAPDKSLQERSEKGEKTIPGKLRSLLLYLCNSSSASFIAQINVKIGASLGRLSRTVKAAAQERASRICLFFHSSHRCLQLLDLAFKKKIAQLMLVEVDA